MPSHILSLRARTIFLALILVAGVPVLSLLTLLTSSATPYLHPTPASKPLTLRGEAALTHLKEQGLYSSLGKAVKEARYSAQPLPSSKSFEFFNPENGLHATFDAEDPAGTRVAASSNKRQRELAIKLTAYGYDQTLILLSSLTVSAQQNRVEYTHHPNPAIRNPESEITEWFVNNPDGIEHGFVLPAPPDVERQADAALRVVMEIGGDFRAHLSAGTQSVSMIDPAGAAELHYDKLRVYDANSHELPSHFELDGNRLAIVVDDRSAQYPLTIDPLIAQSAQLTAGDAAAEDYFGSAVAISGNTAIVGAPRNDISADTDQGAAYIFVRSGGTWTQQDKLRAPLGTVGDFFGGSVAINGDTAIVGAYLDDAVANVNQGAAYVFKRSADVWTQQDKLMADDGSANDFFGFSVAIDGDTAIIGAHLNDTAANTNQGAAYVFTRSNSTWSQSQKLASSDPAAGALFGISIALDAGTSVIGASGKTERGDTAAGAAYVFVLSGGTWTEQQKLLPDVSSTNNFFGAAVAVSGDTALIGSFGDDIGANADQGSAVVFVRSGSTWTKQAKLTAVDGGADNKFGLSVALSGDLAVVGAIGADLSGVDQGAAYLFSRTDVTWSQQQRLFATGGETEDKFGGAVALGENIVLIGAAFDDVEGNTNQGSVTVHEFGQFLVDQQMLTTANGVRGGSFGESVAISGDTAVVGVPSDVIGENVLQGSVYVFVRNGASWTQQRKITAEFGGELDKFGSSVGISGDTLVIGSPEDDILGSIDQGSAFIFVRTGASWTQQFKLIDADGDEGDDFGKAVAISGDTVVVGADEDDVDGNISEGSASVYVRNGERWDLQEKLTAIFGAEQDDFGESVAINGNVVLVGAPEDDIDGNVDQGSVYVFVRGGEDWQQRAKLTVGAGAARDNFGQSVAISGDTLVAGAPNVTGLRSQGAAYVFVYDGTTWTEQQQLSVVNIGEDRHFGRSVGINGDLAVVGDNPGPFDDGSAYLFVRKGLTWTHQQTLNGPSVQGSAVFGYSVAIEGNTVVVGAPLGDSQKGSAHIFVCGDCPPIGLTPASLPNGSLFVPYNENLFAGGAVPPFNYSISSGTLPPGLNLSLNPMGPVVVAGLLSGTPTMSGSYDFTITATAGNLCTGSRNYTIVIPCPPVTINPVNQNLATGEVGAPYNRTFTMTGPAPYNFTVTGGALPSRLSLNPSTGVLSGTPTVSGTFSFTVRGVNAVGCSGSNDYILTINCPSIRVNPVNPILQPITTGVPFSQTFTATGGTAPYAFSITNGALPRVLALDAATGVLSGTPTVAGPFSFEVRVIDRYGCFGSRAYSLTVNCPTLRVDPANPNLPQGTAGAPFNLPFAATGGTAPYSFSVTNGALPGGLTLDAATGVLSGTATVTGAFSFAIRVADRSGCFGSRAYVLIINCPTISVEPATSNPPNGTVGTPYNHTFSATGGVGSYSFDVVAGALPSGLVLNVSTGVLSGTPTSRDTFIFVLRATDNNGCIGRRQYRIVIN